MACPRSPTTPPKFPIPIITFSLPPANSRTFLFDISGACPLFCRPIALFVCLSVCQSVARPSLVSQALTSRYCIHTYIQSYLHTTAQLVPCRDRA